MLNNKHWNTVANCKLEAWNKLGWGTKDRLSQGYPGEVKFERESTVEIYAEM